MIRVVSKFSSRELYGVILTKFHTRVDGHGYGDEVLYDGSEWGFGGIGLDCGDGYGYNSDGIYDERLAGTGFGDGNGCGDGQGNGNGSGFGDGYGDDGFIDDFK